MNNFFFSLFLFLIKKVSKDTLITSKHYYYKQYLGLYKVTQAINNAINSQMSKISYEAGN